VIASSMRPSRAMALSLAKTHPDQTLAPAESRARLPTAAPCRQRSEITQFRSRPKYRSGSASPALGRLSLSAPLCRASSHRPRARRPVSSLLHDAASGLAIPARPQRGAYSEGPAVA
jgi:hypothetical protein